MTGDAVDVIEFSIPGRAPAAMSGNSRVHWAEKHLEGQDYGLTVFLIAGASKRLRMRAWQRAHVTVTQRAVRLRDHDNFIASFKPGLDAIVRAGIIADDKPSVIDLTVKAEKVKHERDESVHVRIERVEGVK